MPPDRAPARGNQRAHRAALAALVVGLVGLVAFASMAAGIQGDTSLIIGALAPIFGLPLATLTTLAHGGRLGRFALAVNAFCAVLFWFLLQLR